MSLNVLDKLNPICEILGLIYVSKNYDKIMEQSIEELNEGGINGELYIKKNLKLFEKYMKEFKKHMVFQGENELFIYEDEEDTTLFFIILSVILHINDNYQVFDSITDKEARKFILDAYYEVVHEKNCDERDYSLESLDNILKFIEEEKLGYKNKWKLMDLLINPKKNISLIMEYIDANRYAYEQAYKKIEESLDKLMDRTIKYINSGECDIVENIANNNFTIVPTLAFGISIIILKDKLFMGVLTEDAFKERTKSLGNKGDLILKLKSLSDKSKIEIISLLKMEPKYSLEIAESLKLTPATVSYHMSALLETGLVGVEKKKGKVYYNLNKLAIQKFIDDLNNTLL